MTVRLRTSVIAVLLVTVAACTSSASGNTKTSPAPYTATPSVNIITVTGAKPQSELSLVKDKKTVAKATTGADGALVFRSVASGGGYTVQQKDGAKTLSSPALSVPSATDTPPSTLYSSQTLKPGMNYIKMRDGVTLSAMVRLPGPPENGPYPTVVEYSGYDAADPDNPQPSTLIASVLGYATVGVNMRGTGCSGGSFDFFEPLQTTDGYDVVETVAAQKWTKFNQVGMVGISYPGISQLFTAQLQPPSLAAIAPLSVIADTFRSTLYPGGIFNNGFALSWAKDRVEGAKPAAHEWVKKLIASGDTTCKDNQTSHTQAADLLGRIESTKFAEAKDFYLAPEYFVDKITTPVFLSCTFQDEQVGGQCPVLAGEFAGTKKAKFTFVNGYHADPLEPAIFQRWIEFLSLYVKREVPVTPDAVRAALPLLSQKVWGVSNLSLPPDRFAGQTDYQAALAKFEAEPSVRVLFDNGANPSNPGAPEPQFEVSFNKWPPTEKGTALYFGPRGTLQTDKPAAGSDSYVSDPSARPAANFEYTNEDQIWVALPSYNWTPLATGNAVAYTSAPLTQNAVMVGSGSVDFWVKSSAPDTDLQVTLTEVRPDGQETYVQNGWLRASQRKIDDQRSSELRPYQSHSERDAQPLPSGEFSAVRVELFPFAHAFRVGSRLRISIEAPGGDRPRWTFDSIDATTKPTNTVAFGGDTPSRIVLPVVPSVDVTTPLPPCPSLRGQPCRAYVPVANGG